MTLGKAIFNSALTLAALIGTGNAQVAQSASYWQSGYISDITYTGDGMLIKLSTGMPDNCAGTSYGWMEIPAANKPMLAFVTGIWLRGDISSVGVTIYTSGLAGAYCQIGQIDPG